MDNPYPHAGSRASTMFGMLAVVFWSTTVAFSRGLTENLGVLTAACAIYLGGGLTGCAILLIRRGGWARIKSVTRRYWLVCGGSFVANIICFHMAVGLAHGRQGIIEVALINYLWISFTLLFSVPVLGNRARWGLWPGMFVACAGVVLATVRNGPFVWTEFASNARANAPACLLALIGAVAWAVYSNFNRRWESESGDGPTPVFLVASGVIFVMLRLGVHEITTWTPAVAVGLFCTVLFPTILAYIFWDIAMRRGNMVLVVSVSYLTPVLSTIINCLYCSMAPSPSLWMACLLVAGGAALCRRSIMERSTTDA